MESLENALDTVVEFLPKLVGFLLILIIGWFIARLIAKAVDKILERVGFDRAVERGGVKQMLEKSKYDASTMVSKIVYYALLLFVLQLAFGVFGPNPISGLLTDLISFLPAIVVAIIIVVIAAAIAKGAQDLITNALAGLSYGKLLGQIAGIAILAIGIIAALNQVGVATTVTTPILIAILAMVAGVVIVGVGGGLVRPMQQRWEDWLSRLERESRNLSRRRDTSTTADAGAPLSPATPYSGAETDEGLDERGRYRHMGRPTEGRPDELGS